MKNRLNNRRYAYFSLILCILLIVIIDCIKVNADASEVVKILDNGDAATHIDLAFIGSGFTTQELDTYRVKVQNNMDKMFTVNWFLNNKILFNIWRIEAVSSESGQDLSEDTLVLEASAVPYDILIILHNYDGQETYSSKRVDLFKYSDGYVVVAHELGHVIGKLDDEYFDCPVCASKCDGLSKRTLNVHDQPNNEKWPDLIAAAPYEGARFCSKGLWRPSENSIMRDSANSIYFDAVGMKAMDLGAGKIIGTIETVAPSLSISDLNDNDTKSGSFTAEAVTTDASGIERVEFYWAKAGETSESIKIDRTLPYDIAIDTTKYEDGQYYLDTLSYDKNWNYIRLTRVFNISNVPPDPQPEPEPEPQPIPEFNVPIIVQEALTLDSCLCEATWDSGHSTCQRQNMPGIDRINEPLTVGIPLAEDSGITDISQLGLSGVNVQQFRPLAYWPNGNIKWVLVDTQVIVLKETIVTINLVDGSGNNGGSNLAVDETEYIEVNTGPAQFKVKKKNFNFIDKAVVNNKDMVLEDNMGGLSITGYEDTVYTLKLDNTNHTLVKDMVYDSKNDADSTAIIEENGPVRAVIKAMGALKDAQGNRFMDYTVRLHFYKDKSYVKAVVILRHGREEIFPNVYNGYDQRPRVFSNVQLSIPLNIGENKQFEFTTKDGLVSGSINNTAYMYQGFSMAYRKSTIENDKLDGTTGWGNPPMERIEGNKDTGYIQKGLEIKNGEEILRALGNASDWTRGFAGIEDQNTSGLSIALQYMSACWPASIEFSDQGNVEIGVFSKYNSKKDIKMAWSTHETREIMLNFHTSTVDNIENIYRLEQPVVGRVLLEQYRTTKVLFGQDGLVSVDEMDSWWDKNYGSHTKYQCPAEAWKPYNIGNLVWRVYWYSGVEGTDWPLNYSYVFLKNGAGGRYMSGLQKTIFNTDSGIRRTDGFDYSVSKVKSDYRYPVIDTGAYNAGGGQNHFDYAHNHWRAMPIYYYMTGNEEIKEAINDYMEEFIKTGAFAHPKLESDLRCYARYYSTVALGYEFNKDVRLKAILETMTADILDSRDLPPQLKPLGRNLERGYLWLDASYFKEQTVHSFFLYTIFSEDAWQALRVFKTYSPAYTRIEDLEDCLLGISQFMYNESYFVKPGGSDFGYVYDYSLVNPNQWIDSDTAGISGNYMRKDDSSRAMWFAYKKTGGIKYLERGKKLLAFGGGVGSSTAYPAQDLMYADLYGVLDFWQYVDNVHVANNGENNYTLTWDVPEKATAYQIKFSDKPIVDWLGFDQLTRQYQYGPASHTAFFAAWNIDNEPQPLEAGQTQSFTIDIPSNIVAYNSARGLEAVNPSYIIYDAGKQYYFSIKYLSSEAQTPEELQGDINADGKVNVFDVQACVNVLLGGEQDADRIKAAKEAAEPLDKCDVLDVQAVVNKVLGG